MLNINNKKNRNFRNREKRGSALVVALFIALAIVLIIGGYLKITSQELKKSEDSLVANAILNLSEAAAEEALWALNHDDWSDWSDMGDRMVRELTGFDIGNGKTGGARVIVVDYGTDDPIIYVEGLVDMVDGRTLSRQLRINATTRGLFANGLTAEDKIIFDEAGADTSAIFDGYNSAAGPYHAFLNRTDSGAIGSDDVTTSNADVYGFVSTNDEAPVVGESGKIYGAETDSGISIDSNRITNDFTSDFRDRSAPPLSSSALTSLPDDDVKTIGDVSGFTTAQYSLDKLEIDEGEALVVEGPVVMVVENDVDIEGIVEVQETGSLRLYVGGDYTMNGYAHANLTNDPLNFLIFGTDTVDGRRDFTIDTGSSMAAGIYAPNAVITFIGAGATEEDKDKDKDKDSDKDKSSDDKDKSSDDKDKSSGDEDKGTGSLDLEVQPPFIVRALSEFAFAAADDKITICHRPPGNPDNVQTLEVAPAALAGHMNSNGTLHDDDTYGACVEDDKDKSSGDKDKDVGDKDKDVGDKDKDVGDKDKDKDVGDKDKDKDTEEEDERTLICHVPAGSSDDAETLWLPKAALEAHLASSLGAVDLDSGFQHRFILEALAEYSFAQSKDSGDKDKDSGDKDKDSGDKDKDSDDRAELHGDDYYGACEEEDEGPGELFGAVLGYQIFVYGTYNFHYDEQLKDTGDTTYTLSSWHELIKPSDKIDFQSFIDLINEKLGEDYQTDNPPTDDYPPPNDDQEPGT